MLSMLCMHRNTCGTLWDYTLYYLLRPKRSFMPSRSKPRVKRMVWSRGLPCAVAMQYAASTVKTLMCRPAPTVKYCRLPLWGFS